jgi:hypothetical protein
VLGCAGGRGHSTAGGLFATLRGSVRRLAALAPIALALIAASGCARCSGSRDAPDAGPVRAPSLPDLLPAPRPWSFVRLRVESGLALPTRCRFRAPVARAEVPSLTRFVAEPRTPGTLVVADAVDPSAPRLTGVAALTLDPEGPTRDPVALPWFEPAALPRLARAGNRWLAALDRSGAIGTRVVLWRAGAVELLAEGDGLEATDLACAPTTPQAADAAPPAPARCALLTTRLGKVAAPGATVWLGSPEDPASRWRSIEIAPAAGSDARPLGIAAIDTGEPVTAALFEKGDVVFHAVEPAPREIARLPAPLGAIDAALVPKPAVMALASQVDDDGCARDGKPGVRFVREGAPPVEFALPAPPTHGVLRRLAHGAIAAWMAPIGCRMPRKALYALVLDESGAPVGTPIPIGDATEFAVATHGDDVDVWLQDASGVTWARADCAPR